MFFFLDLKKYFKKMDILEALRESHNVLENVVDQNVVIGAENVVIGAENVVIGAENVFVNDQNIDNLIEKDLLGDKDDKKRKFYQILYSNKDFQKRLVAIKSIIRRKKEHFELIEEIKSSYNKLPKSRTRREKYLFNQYAVLNVEGEDKMINKDQINEAKPLVYTFLENLYDDLKREHEQVGHGGRDKTHKQCKQVNSNVTVEVINIWLQTCVECILRTRKNTISGLVVKPVRSHDILSRGQVDLNQVDDNYGRICKWIQLNTEQDLMKMLNNIKINEELIRKEPIEEQEEQEEEEIILTSNFIFN